MKQVQKGTAERRVRDTEVPELFLVVSARGKSWRVRYRRDPAVKDASRIDVTHTIGAMPAKRAREIARAAIRLADAVLRQLAARNRP